MATINFSLDTVHTAETSMEIVNMFGTTLHALVQDDSAALTEFLSHADITSEQRAEAIIYTDGYAIAFRSAGPYASWDDDTSRGGCVGGVSTEDTSIKASSCWTWSQVVTSENTGTEEDPVMVYTRE